MRVRTALVLLLALALTLPGTVVSDGGNEPPLADGGLDQTVSIGDTVLLDAGGSRDPDGSIASYDWRVVAPNGSTFSPACPSCERTRFVPDETGVYAVEITVTDDDGASSTDRFTVTVESAGGPSVSLTGPRTAEVGNTSRYRVTVEAGDARLSELVWRVNGSVVERTDLAGRKSKASLQWSFSTVGEHDVSVTAVDEGGERASDANPVAVSTPSNDPPSVSLSGPDVVEQGETASFTADASDTDGSVVDYAWSNAGTAQGDHTVRTFDEPAGSLVTLSVTVEDDDGAPATAYKTVEVVGNGDAVSNFGTTTSTATETSTPTSTLTSTPTATSTPTSTPTATATPEPKAPPAVGNVDIVTSRGATMGKDATTSIISEAEDTLIFTVSVDPGTAVAGETVDVTINFGDGTSQTLTATVQSGGTLPEVQTQHDYPAISESTTRTVTVQASSADGTSPENRETVDFLPRNPNVNGVEQYGVDLSAPDETKRGEPATVTVSNSPEWTTPPKVLVNFGNGEKKIFNPDDIDFDKEYLGITYESVGDYTVKASGQGMSSDANVKPATEEVSVVAQTYDVYEYTERNRERNTDYKTAEDDPGDDWTFVEVIDRSEERVDGSTFTQPVAMPDPSASDGYKYKSSNLRYDPDLNAYVQDWTKYEVVETSKWKNVYYETKKGDEVASLTEPQSSTVYGYTLEKNTYKCTNDDAPKRDAACGSTGNTGTGTGAT
jgi:hypothetical protein